MNLRTKIVWYICLALTVTSGCGKSSDNGGKVNLSNVENVWYSDADGDGFGDKKVTSTLDIQPSGYVDNDLDCNDSNATINPMAVENPDDGVDNNCNVEVDEAPKPGIVPDTGQIKSYTDTFGEDSDFITNAQSYTKLDDNGQPLPDTAISWSMVKDNITGLIWEFKNSLNNEVTFENPHDADNIYTWEKATSVCIKALNDTNFGNFNDGKSWRLPTIKELNEITDNNIINPSLNTTYFPFMTTGIWSSTTSPISAASAYYFVFNIGMQLDGIKAGMHNVWAVRGDKAVPSLEKINDNIVIDTNTGLMWQKTTATGEDGKGYTFEQALIYCHNLNISGYTDWRLPSKNEIMTIVNYSNQRPTIQTDFFPDTKSSFYWTSTTQSNNSSIAWSIDFSSGAMDFSRGKKSNYFVRAVRGGIASNLTTWYRDGDGDKFGDPAVSIKIIATYPQPSGYVSNNEDCNDAEIATNPLAPEIANDGIDQNCNGKDLANWYYDQDGDGYGTPITTTLSEDQPARYVSNNLDFNDFNISIHPGMSDLLGDSLDNDCNGKSKVFWYRDQDGDRYGSGLMVGAGEDPPDFVNYYANNDRDCDDVHANIHPGLVGSDGCYTTADIEDQKNIPDTGQTKTYTGIGNEDGDISINSPSYTEKIGYIHDNVTGLDWELKLDTNRYTYSEAQTYVSALASSNYAGFKDWRLPTAGELAMIANLDKSNPAINTDYFKNIPAEKYWTSTETDTIHQLAISFRYGESYEVIKTDATLHVMAVRGRKSIILMEQNPDNTVTQKNTGLIWNVNEYDSHNWTDSYTYWTGLTIDNNLVTSCGYSDWRLPTADEVESLINLIEENQDLHIEDYLSGVDAGVYFWTYTLSGSSATKAMIYCLILNNTSRNAVTNYALTNSYSICKSLGVRGIMMPRFIDNGDGTVLDSKTGLMWMQVDADSGTKMTFLEALNYCKNTLNVTGYPTSNANSPGSQTYTDWRVPNRNELLSLLDAATNAWEIYDKAFPNSGSLYWSSSSSCSIIDNAWQINFERGGITLANYNTQSNVVRLVRGGRDE